MVTTVDAEDLVERLGRPVGHAAWVLESLGAAHQDVDLHHLLDAVQGAELGPGHGNDVVDAKLGGTGSGADRDLGPYPSGVA
jgi:hypothetical protein